METLGGAIALVELVETSVKTGKKIVDKIQAYKQANYRVKDLIIRVEGVWLKTEVQIGVLQEICDLTTERFQDFQEECIERLNTKLQAALLKLEGLSELDFHEGINLGNISLNMKKRNKSKFSVLEKSLEGLVNDLEKWHSVFDPSWYLPVIRIRDNRIDNALSSADPSEQKQESVTVVQQIREQIHAQDSSKLGSIFLDPSAISAPTEQLKGCSLQVSHTTTDNTAVLVETTAYPVQADKNATMTFVRDIARLLASSQPDTLGFLQCLGVVRKEDSSQFQYIHILPKLGPRTLRDLLSQELMSLDTRFQLAKGLAKSTMSLHTANFVHKNIRPDNIVVIGDEHNGTWSSFLVGFQELRLATAHSTLIADMVWERNLYRYPTRQGLRLQDYYTMQHDIYSLGVCLLEIGLWISFITSAEDNPQPNPSLNISTQLEMRNKTEAAKQIKRTLIDEATTKLPSKMGQTYTDVVISCLTCLDQGASNMFENEKDIHDEDGLLIGVAFIEKVLLRLDSIQI